MARLSTPWGTWKFLFATILFTGAMAADILTTSGFSDCGPDTTIKVDKLDITYDNANKIVTFDVAGTSTKEQNVTARLSVTAYGNQIYERSFNPCDQSTFVQQLCPLPAGSFAARGSQEIPAQFASMVPGIAFQIPDIAADAKLELDAVGSGETVACIQSSVTNGKTVNVPAVSYVAAGIAGVAFLASGISAAGAAVGGGAAGGAGTISPSFTETFGWFQGMAMNGMLSVSYPPVYQSFTKNFAFSVGLVPWPGMLSAIDDMRAKTGGNLTHDNVEYVTNATAGQGGLFHIKRAIDSFAAIALRDIETSVNSTADNAPASTTFQQKVQGIEAFAQEVSVPKSDIFMTALLIVAIVIASIVVAILLVKVILEAWSIWGTFPESLKGFRKHYWGSIARTITSLILVLYGIWVLYCIFQFTRADSSWVPKTLAGVSLGIFTGILAFFTWKIYSTVRKLKVTEGDANSLFDDKDTWMKYSLFYDAYRRSYWWLFVPVIFYMFAKGASIAAGDGHGMAQTIAQLVIEGLMLSLLVWSRPYERRSGNVLNIIIQTVRVLSVACILIFVEELGVAQTTKTVTGVVLIAVQSTLTGILAILVAWNAIQVCITANPHRARRKAMERNRELDVLTPLDAHNSLLIRPGTGEKSLYSLSTVDSKEKETTRTNVPNPYSYYNRYADDVERQPAAPSGGYYYDEPERDLTRREPPTVGYAQQTTQPGPGYGNYRGLPPTKQDYHF